MNHPMLAALCAVSLPVALTAQGLTAVVNDAQSHGAVGSPALSLDEAIRLANGTLTVAQLSAAEAAQISGTGTTVTTIQIPHATLPMITVGAPLTALTGPGGANPAMVRIEGVGNGGSMHTMPMLMGGAQPTVLSIRTPRAMVMGLTFTAGQVAIDVNTGTGSMTDMAMVMHCMFMSQSTAAIRAHAAGSDDSAVMVMDSMFHAMPLAFQYQNNAATGMLMIEGERCEFDGCNRVALIDDNGSGQMSMFMLFRSKVRNAATFVRSIKGALSTGQLMLRFTHLDVVTSGHVCEVVGAPWGSTMVHHHNSIFRTTPGNRAMWVYPRTAVFDIHGSEMEFHGNVELAANLFSQRIWQQNNRYVGSQVVLDIDGAQPNLLWNRFENCTITVPHPARALVRIRTSHLDNTTVHCSSLLSSATLLGCWRNGGALTGTSSEQNPSPAPFLGSAQVLNTEPRPGEIVTLQSTLPFGIGAYWVIAPSVSRPITTAEPVRYYGDPFNAIPIPGLLVYNAQLAIPVPMDPGLIGLEYYAQAVDIPIYNNAWAPTFHLPAGATVRIRM